MKKLFFIAVLSLIFGTMYCESTDAKTELIKISGLGKKPVVINKADFTHYLYQLAVVNGIKKEEFMQKVFDRDWLNQQLQSLINEEVVYQLALREGAGPGAREYQNIDNKIIPGFYVSYRIYPEMGSLSIAQSEIADWKKINQKVVEKYNLSDDQKLSAVLLGIKKKALYEAKTDEISGENNSGRQYASLKQKAERDSYFRKNIVPVVKEAFIYQETMRKYSAIKAAKISANDTGLQTFSRQFKNVPGVDMQEVKKNYALNLKLNDLQGKLKIVKTDAALNDWSELQELLEKTPAK